MLDQSVTLDLVVSVERRGDTVVVVPEGEIDAYTTPTLREHLTDALASGAETILVDLRRTAYADSTRLGALIGCWKNATARAGSLEAAGDHERLLELFDLTGRDEVFVIHHIEAEAESA